MLKLLHWCLTLCQARHAWIKVVLIGLLLAAPALFMGWHIDDFNHRQMLIEGHSPGGDRGTLFGLFSWASGDPALTQIARDRGEYVWWFPSNMQVTFLRPVAEVTHWLDHALWPDSPTLMHLHSLLWYGATIAAALLLFCRIGGWAKPWIATLAGLLFAIDSGHMLPTVLINNRNSMLALCWGILCLLLHDLWQRQQRWLALPAAMLCLALSLLSCEIGVATAGYLFAYALFLTPGAWWHRARSLLPYLITGLVWAAWYKHFDFGVRNGWAYVNPLTNPAEFLAVLIERTPVLLMGQWFFPPSDIPATFFQGGVLRWGWWVLCVVVLAYLAKALWKMVRSEASARFWLTGSLLSVVPATTALPGDRQLMFVGLGAAALLAQWLAHWQASPARTHRHLGAILLFCNLPASALLFPLLAIGFHLGAVANFEQPAASLQATEADAPAVWLLIDAPSQYGSTSLQAIRDARHLPHPAQHQFLGATPGRIEAVLTDPHTLEISADKGFGSEMTAFLPMNHADIAAQRSPHFQVEILDETPEHLVRKVRFRFSEPVSSDHWRWWKWHGTTWEAVRWSPGEARKVWE